MEFIPKNRRLALTSLTREDYYEGAQPSVDEVGKKINCGEEVSVKKKGISAIAGSKSVLV